MVRMELSPRKAGAVALKRYCCARKLPLSVDS
jgi:hypothetical protein